MKRGIYRTDNKGLEEAISVLRKGGVIAFPTDTVYGIGCDADDNSAITRIFKMKKRKREKPLVMFISHKRLIRDFVIKPTNTRRRLCENFFPGPLTLIMKAKKSAPQGLLSRNKTISIRIPDNNFLKRLLMRYKKSLATTSANISGEMPPTKYKNIKLDVDLLLMNDTIPSGIPSTILDLAHYPFVLRRKGSISIFTIERYIPSKARFDESIVFNVLFVCTGNSCRSPIAEGIFKKFLQEKRLKNVHVSSCGILAGDGFFPSKNAVLAAHERGYNIEEHRSRHINRKIVGTSDLILCMEIFHKNEVYSLLPKCKDKVFLLTEFHGKDGEIDDPIGGDMSVYRKVTKDLERYVKKVADEFELRYLIKEHR